MKILLWLFSLNKFISHLIVVAPPLFHFHFIFPPNILFSIHLISSSFIDFFSSFISSASCNEEKQISNSLWTVEDARDYYVDEKEDDDDDDDDYVDEWDLIQKNDDVLKKATEKNAKDYCDTI